MIYRRDYNKENFKDYSYLKRTDKEEKKSFRDIFKDKKVLVIGICVAVLLIAGGVFSFIYFNGADNYPALAAVPEGSALAAGATNTNEQATAKAPEDNLFKDMPTGLNEYLYQHDRKYAQIGITESIFEYGPVIKSVNYPVLGKDSIDSVIFAKIQELISEFDAKTAKSGELTEYASAAFDTNYESYLVNNRIASIKIKYECMLPGMNRPETKYTSLLFDLNLEKQMSLDDIFSGEYLAFFSSYVKNYLLTSNEYRGLNAEDINTAGIEPGKENYPCIVPNNSGVNIIFERGSILPESFGEVETEIPYSELKDYLKIEITDAPLPSSTPKAAPVSNNVDYISFDPSTVKGVIALTFDDGPTFKHTNKILDVLREYDARATFFVVGQRANSNENTLNRIVAEGSEIGNHTYNHKKLNELSENDIIEELVQTNNVIKQITGVEPQLMRLPFGSATKRVSDIVAMPIIGWDIDPKDWSHKDKDRTIKEILDKVKDGDVVLMHDFYAQTAEAIEVVVPELAARGFKMVTVSELAAIKGTPLVAGNTYRKFN